MDKLSKINPKNNIFLYLVLIFVGLTHSLVFYIREKCTFFVKMLAQLVKMTMNVVLIEK